MNRIFMRTIFLLLLIFAYQLQAQKLIRECSMKYSLTVVEGQKDAELLNGTEIIVYVKGNQSRQDRSGSLGKEISIYDGRTSTGKIIKSYGGQDLMIELTKAEWGDAKHYFRNLNFVTSQDTATIGKFNCQIAYANGPAGIPYQYKLFFDPLISLSNRDFEFSFGNIQGLPVRIELSKPGFTLIYDLISFKTEPVSYSVFDIPKGYKVISYKDFISLQKGKEG